MKEYNWYLKDLDNIFVKINDSRLEIDFNPLRI